MGPLLKQNGAYMACPVFCLQAEGLNRRMFFSPCDHWLCDTPRMEKRCHAAGCVLLAFKRLRGAGERPFWQTECGQKRSPWQTLDRQRWAMQPKAIATATTAELNLGMESSAYFASVAERVPNTAHQIRQSPAWPRGKANAPTLAASVFGRHVNAVARPVG